MVSDKIAKIQSCSAHTIVTPPVSHIPTGASSQIETLYSQAHTEVKVENDKVVTKVVHDDFRFRTDMRVPRTGVLVVGLGGNNGTTFAAGIIANRAGMMWETQHGEKRANWLGSVAMTATMKLGIDSDTKADVYVPVRSILPMLHPNDLEIGGWDISGLDMASAMKRAAVLPIQLQHQLKADMNKIPVWPGVYCKDAIATNQEVRADNVLPGTQKEKLEALKKNIADFRKEKNLDKVIVVWSGNTERFFDHTEAVHGSAEGILKAIDDDSVDAIAPSLLYAVAAVQSGCCYINGSPQNTFCPGLVDLARKHGVYLAGDDLKTGQTKLKSVLIDFLVSTAIKPISVCSYNHLGNNDGLNLSSQSQFRSKEITKASVIDDMIASNDILYPKDGKKPDHLIVIKYIPAVGDSKRALDEYTAEIFMHGLQTFVVHNTCEDSLLAVPIILDLVLFIELLDRITVAKLPKDENDATEAKFERFHPVQSLLSLFLKAPQVPEDCPVVNAFFTQREALFSLIRAAAGLPPQDYLSLPQRLENS